MTRNRYFNALVLAMLYADHHILAWVQLGRDRDIVTVVDFKDASFIVIANVHVLEHVAERIVDVVHFGRGN